MSFDVPLTDVKASGDPRKDEVESSRHRSIYDTDEMNRAFEKASTNNSFIRNAVLLLDDMKFPAFKQQIIEYLQSRNAPKEEMALFQTLNGYMQFNDTYHVQKALEESNMQQKKANQITDQTREHPNLKTRDTQSGTSIKDREAVNEKEERSDYPEVTPTAMSNFVCNHCGKQFQNQDDLFQHQRFEKGSVTESS